MNTQPKLSYQRTGSLDRSTLGLLAWFAGSLLVVTTLLVLPPIVGLVDASLLGAMRPVAMVSATAILFVLHRLSDRTGGFFTTAAVRPARPIRPILLTSLGVLGAVCVLFVVREGILILFGVTSIAVAPEAWELLPLVPVFLVVTMIPVAGEEFAWRGYVQTLLAPWGFWRACTAIGAYWTLWHMPLLVGYVFLGEMLVREFIAVAVGIFVLTYVLGGVRYLSGSVWPAVFGHALVNTLLVYLSSNFTTSIAGNISPNSSFWAFYGVDWLLWLGLTAVVAWLVYQRNRLSTNVGTEREAGPT